MDAKRRPGTPLPFTLEQETFIYSNGENFISPAYYIDPEDGQMTRGQAINNLKYLVHTANAYPLLVAALKEAIDTLPPDFRHTGNAVLRSLGEL